MHIGLVKLSSGVHKRPVLCDSAGGLRPLLLYSIGHWCKELTAASQPQIGRHSATRRLADSPVALRITWAHASAVATLASRCRQEASAKVRGKWAWQVNRAGVFCFPETEGFPPLAIFPHARQGSLDFLPSGNLFYIYLSWAECHIALGTNPPVACMPGSLWSSWRLSQGT